MTFIEQVATLTYSIIDMIAIELLLASIFIVQEGGKIKLTIDYLFGLSTYRKTYYFVFVLMALGVGWFYTSNLLQNKLISLLTATGWKVFPTFVLAASFFIFWLTKVNLGRRWNFKMVWISGLICVISALILIIPAL